MALRLTETRRALIVLTLFFIAAAHIDFVNFIEKRNKECIIPFLQWSDEAFYYAFAHSLAFDGDADLTNQFRFIAFGPIGIPLNGLFYGDYFAAPDLPIRSKVGIGTALLTLPFVLMARLAAAIYESCGGGEIHPYSAVYLWAYKVGMLFWAFAGIGAGYSLLRRIGRSPGSAAASMGAAVLGLSILYYIIFENAWTHTISFGWVTLFLLFCARWHESLKRMPPPSARWLAPLLVGLSGGLCCSIRFNNILLLPVPLIVCIHEGLRRASWGGGMGCDDRRRLFFSLGIIGTGLIIGFLPQMLVWRSMYGELLVNTYGRFGERLYSWPRYFFQILFSPHCGLFLWTPLAVLATAGLILGIRREGRTSPGPWICCYSLFAAVWLSGWHMGQTFGARYQSDYTFVFAYGLSVVFILAQRGGIAAHLLRAAVAVLILWNFYLVTAFRAYVVGGPDPRVPQKPFSLYPLIAERRTIWDQFRKDFSLAFDTGLYTDYRRRYPLMTPADLGLPTAEEHQRMFDPADEMGSFERWRRTCITHSERIMNRPSAAAGKGR